MKDLDKRDTVGMLLVLGVVFPFLAMIGVAALWSGEFRFGDIYRLLAKGRINTEV
mgnify:CR=1 FL=1